MLVLFFFTSFKLYCQKYVPSVASANLDYVVDSCVTPFAVNGYIITLLTLHFSHLIEAQPPAAGTG